MIIVWKGLGGIVALIWFGAIFAGDKLAKVLFGQDVSNGLSNLTGEWLASAVTLVFSVALWWYRRSNADPWAQPEGGAGSPDTLFWIPVIAWPGIFLALGVGIYLTSKPPAPPLVEVTASAADRLTQEAKALGARRDWHVRLAAHWPEGADAPQHKMEIVIGQVKESDYVAQSRGVKIAVPNDQVEMFRRARLLFGEKDGFVVDNPNFEGEQLEKWRAVLREMPAAGTR